MIWWQILKFKRKIKSRIKEIREELNHMTQQELADRVGVSRQTIYFLEKGKYNPSLTLSFKLSEVLNKPLNEIFYQEPVIKDIIENKDIKFKDLDALPEIIGIDHDILQSFCYMDDEELNKFEKPILLKIAKYLGKKFEELFEE